MEQTRTGDESEINVTTVETKSMRSGSIEFKDIAFALQITEDMTKRAREIKEPGVKYTLMLEKLHIWLSMLTTLAEPSIINLPPDLSMKTDASFKDLKLDLAEIANYIRSCKPS